MSGILAVFHRDGRPVDAGLLRRMAATMADAGPDGTDVWTHGEIGLAVASFHTVPEQVGERAPLVQGDLAIAFDGRIDNREELRRAFRRAGLDVPALAGDGAHVIAAYRLWGEELGPQLIGEHAFVLWDGQRRRIVALRDHMAVRALRWWSDGSTVVACSLFAPILAHPDVAERPNEGVIAEWLCDMPTTIDESLWEGVSCVPGGGRLRAGRERAARVDRYWRAQDEIGRRAAPSAGEAREALTEILTEAVRCRLRAIGRPLVELSGGWDSSTVAVVAHDLHASGQASDFELYSALYPGLSCDEEQWIGAVERQLGRIATKRRAEPMDAAAYDRAVHRQRHPFATDQLRSLAVSGQRRVGLTGHGGDEIVGGVFYDLGTLLDPRRRRRVTAGVGARGLLHATVGPVLRPMLPVAARARRLPRFPPWVAPDLIARTALADRISRREPLVRRGRIRARSLSAALDGWGFQMQDLLGELERGRYLEYRHPLLDIRLVRLALSLTATVAGTFETDPRRLHDAAFGARLPAPVRQRRHGPDFTPFAAQSMANLRTQHRGCPTLAAEGWVIESRIGPLDDQATTSGGLVRALMAYSIDAWHTDHEDVDDDD